MKIFDINTSFPMDSILNLSIKNKRIIGYWERISSKKRIISKKLWNPGETYLYAINLTTDHQAIIYWKTAGTRNSIFISNLDTLTLHRIQGEAENARLRPESKFRIVNLSNNKMTLYWTELLPDNRYQNSVIETEVITKFRKK